MPRWAGSSLGRGGGGTRRHRKSHGKMGHLYLHFKKFAFMHVHCNVKVQYASCEMK